ncbi:MAG: hypothetical protein QNJ36_18870 [Calothrix sp. MO_167.B42]|nr:hypothetical protein [Calothrix sp. MO_167.B42]
MFTNSNSETKETPIKDLSIIAWMIGQIENKNRQHTVKPTNYWSFNSISVDAPEKKELGIEAKVQHLISRPQPQASRNSGNNIIYFQNKSTTVDLEALSTAITLQK